MTPEIVIDLVRQAITVVLMITGPILIVSVSVGLLISILQTTTSIQEQTLTFVPKIIAVLGAIVYFGSYIVAKVTDFAMQMFQNITAL